MQKLKWYKLAVTLLLNYLSDAQETGSITGKVIDRNNHPVEYANVFIAAPNDTAKILNATITDSTGIFLLSNVPDGTKIPLINGNYPDFRDSVLPYVKILINNLKTRL
jgi:hypothetical protein